MSGPRRDGGGRTPPSMAPRWGTERWLARGVGAPDAIALGVRRPLLVGGVCPHRAATPPAAPPTTVPTGPATAVPAAAPAAAPPTAPVAVPAPGPADLAPTLPGPVSAPLRSRMARASIARVTGVDGDQHPALAEAGLEVLRLLLGDAHARPGRPRCRRRRRRCRPRRRPSRRPGRRRWPGPRRRRPARCRGWPGPRCPPGSPPGRPGGPRRGRRRRRPSAALVPVLLDQLALRRAVAHGDPDVVRPEAGGLEVVDGRLGVRPLGEQAGDGASCRCSREPSRSQSPSRSR